MTEENKQIDSEAKKSVFSKTWVKVTAGVLGGVVVLSGTFVTGAVAGAKADQAGFSRVAHAAEFDRSQQGKMTRNSEAGHFGEMRHGPRGNQMHGSAMGLAGLDEEQRLERINEWLDSLGIESLDELPEDLTGSPEELMENRRLEMVNKRLERLGLDPLTELPDEYPEN